MKGLDGRIERIMAANQTVYVVDDDEAVRVSLAALFEARGYNVRGFASAPSFLSAAAGLARQRHPPEGRLRRPLISNRVQLS